MLESIELVYYVHETDTRSHARAGHIHTHVRRTWTEFLRLLFLQADRETEAHFNAIGMPRNTTRTSSVFAARPSIQD